MSASTGSLVVVHQPESGRFEISIGDMLAVAEYVRGVDELVLTRTFVPPALRGRGLTEALVCAALDFARTERLRVIPACSYVAAFVERHPDLVAPSE